MVFGKLKKLFIRRSSSGSLKEKEKIEEDRGASSSSSKKDRKKKSEEYEVDRQHGNITDEHTDDIVENEEVYERGRSDDEGEEQNQDNNECDREGNDSDSEDCGNEDSDDSDEAFVGQFVFEEQPKSFSCLSPGDIVAYQEKEIAEIADLLLIEPSVAGALLRHFQWKKEKLMQKYFEDPQKVCKDAGVPYTASATSPRRHLERSGNSFSICSICGDDELTPLTASALSCHHLFCNDCWGSYITTKITEGEPQMRCPHLKCTIHVDDVFVKRMVSGAIYDKYLQFVTKNFVQENDRVRWCPTPGCNNAITFDQANSTNDSAIVECACGYKFCFKCHREAHAPATCEHMKQWEQKCQDDSETFNWKTVNCRECPKCSVAVEKNGGCNHMTCRQCKYEWCWVCMRAWKGHNDFYSCNRYEKEMLAQQKGKKKSKRKKLEDEKEKKRAALERYLHYYERFVNHDNSRKLEIELRATALAKMREMQDIDSTRAQVQFIEKSVAELQDCRSVLKYTYVFAFYFLEEGGTVQVQGTAKELFEYLQEDLEKTTEKLSEIIEETLKTTEIDNSQKLYTINQTNIAKTKRENLLNAVSRDPLFNNES